MNIRKQSNASLYLFFLSCVAVFLPGCVQFQQGYPDIRTYSLEVNEPKHVTSAASPVAVHLKAFGATSQCQDRFFVYRTGAMLYESDFYNQLAASPARMIEDLTQNYLQGSPVVRFVLKSGFASHAHYEIQGQVIEMYGDYRQAKEPKAVLVLEFTVSDVSGEKTQVLWQKRYQQSIPIKRPVPEALAEGWSRGLGEIEAVFESDFKEVASSGSTKT